MEVTSTGPSKHKLTTVPPVPSEHTPGLYLSLNKALDLADCIGVKPTIQTTKTLEECIQKQYEDGPWSKGTYTLGEEPDNEDVDMSIVPSGSQNQEDWVFEEVDPSPTYNLPSDKEPLDWGSADEDKACIPSSLNFHNVHNLPAFLQPPRGIRLLKDGYTKHSSVGSAFSLDPYLSINCEHGHSYAKCSKCKGKLPSKMGTIWLLDSSASTYFMHDIYDFIEYTPFTPSERAPIKTASNVIYIEGKGMVLEQHYIDNKLVTTYLYPVLYSISQI